MDCTIEEVDSFTIKQHWMYDEHDSRMINIYSWIQTKFPCRNDILFPKQYDAQYIGAINEIFEFVRGQFASCQFTEFDQACWFQITFYCVSKQWISKSIDVLFLYDDQFPMNHCRLYAWFDPRGQFAVPKTHDYDLSKPLKLLEGHHRINNWLKNPDVQDELPVQLFIGCTPNMKEECTRFIHQTVT